MIAASAAAALSVRWKRAREQALRCSAELVLKALCKA
jgi:hypothetical protein